MVKEAGMVPSLEGHSRNFPQASGEHQGHYLHLYDQEEKVLSL